MSFSLTFTSFLITSPFPDQSATTKYWTGRRQFSKRGIFMVMNLFSEILWNDTLKYVSKWTSFFLGRGSVYSLHQNHTIKQMPVSKSICKNYSFRNTYNACYLHIWLVSIMMVWKAYEKIQKANEKRSTASIKIVEIFNHRHFIERLYFSWCKEAFLIHTYLRRNRTSIKSIIVQLKCFA